MYTQSPVPLPLVWLPCMNFKLWTGICSLYLRPFLMTVVANYAGFPAQHFQADWSMKLSGERPTLTRGLNKTLEWLMSVCGCLSWYRSSYTQCALRGLATCSHAVIEHWNWKQRMPCSFLFIISLCVVQISQDMGVCLLGDLPSPQHTSMKFCYVCYV